VHVVRARRAYMWPEVALSLLLFVLLVCGAITLGIYSYFTYVQTRLLVAIPWYPSLSSPTHR
jgi:hypothetical protein